MCREYLTTDAGVQVLASPEGKRQCGKLLDFRGLELEELASLEPLAEADISEINMEGCKQLKRLPIESLIEMLHLQTLTLNDCPSLLFPPPEIAARDGAAVVRFMRHKIMDLRSTSLTGADLWPAVYVHV